MNVRSRLAVVLTAASLLGVACGTRLPEAAFEQVAEGGATVPADRAAIRAGAGDTGTEEIAQAGTGEAATPANQQQVSGGPGTTVGSRTDGGPQRTVPNQSGGPTGPNQASDVGVTPTSIKIGNITAITGIIGDAFLPSLRGLQAWVAATNARGGIHGRRIELVFCDDKEDRTKSLECAKRLVEQEKVFAFLANNTRVEGGHAPYLNAAGVPVLNIPISNAAYRFPHYWTVYGTGYPRDGKTVGWKGKLINATTPYRWFKERLGIRKAAVFYYDLAESQQAGKFMVKGLQLEGLEVTEFPINFANPNFDQPAAQMKARGIEIVFDAIDDGANRKLCDAMSRNGFVPKAKVSTIVAFGQSLGTDFPKDCRNVYYITHDSANAWDTSNPVVRAFRADFARYKPRDELHQWSLEGWAIGRMFGQAIESMGPAPTRKGLEDWLRSLKDYTDEGLWNPKDYQPVNYDVVTRETDCVAVSRWQDSANGWVTQAAPGTSNACFPDVILFPSDPAEQGD